MSQICHAHNCRAVQKNETHPFATQPLTIEIYISYTLLWSTYCSLCTYCPFHADPTFLSDFLHSWDGSVGDTYVARNPSSGLVKPSQARIVAADSK